MIITQDKYIIKIPNKTLTLKGFVMDCNIYKCQVRLFNSPSHARSYMQEGNFKSKNYEIKKVLVQIEVLEDE